MEIDAKDKAQARVLDTEDWVLCRVFQKKKGDGDGDGAGAPSPTFTGSTSSHLQPPDHHPAAATGGYYVVDSQAGYSAGDFAPPQTLAVATQPAAAPQYQYGGAVLGFPEEFGGTRAGVAEEYGFGYFDTACFDVDDTASTLGGIRFPQG
ncbi:hypothetical protein E2562_005519 [Oryza meyeriana var. granulata]|uniref:NAC domain-containing protein n=1 Tax=Oryza meyeriana var. granulata TaxID=110450 RepID=A0A6G1F3Z3_9ORYZ|nr:hypothetical protein E2562_005519 [Oryza meyeriana var. granulata]